MDRKRWIRSYLGAMVAVTTVAGTTVLALGTMGTGPAFGAQRGTTSAQVVATLAPGRPPVTAPAVHIVDYPTAPNTFPAALTSGPQGKLWFTEDISDAVIGSFDPSSHTFAKHALKMGVYAFKAQGIAVDRSDHLWMSANGSYAYQFNPSNSTSLNYQKAVSGSEQSVALGVDGDMWFTGSDLIPGSFIYRVDPATGAFTPYPVAGGSGYLFGITSGPGGNLWFADPANNAIGELDPADGHTAEFTIPTPDSSPGAITAGPDHALWFTEGGTDRIGRFDPATSTFTHYDIPTANTLPRCITVGPDGDIWFTEEEHAAVGSIDPATGAVREYSVAAVDPSGTHTFLDGITTGPDGNLWVTDEQGQLLRVSLSPRVQGEPSSQSVPEGSRVRFSASARGIPVPSVQWEASHDGGATWSSIAGATSDALSLTASPGATAEYRAVFTNSAGTAVSSPASLTLSSNPAGYWLVGKDGGVFAFGDAPFLGSLPSVGIHPDSSIVGIAPTPSGDGYWLVGADGGVFAFGDATFFGSLPSIGTTPGGPVVGVAPSRDGRGYWLVSADGEVYGFGDATNSGGAPPTGTPAVGIAASESDAGNGYWIADAFGGITASGSAGAHGSLTTAIPPVKPAAPIVAVAGSADGGGYWLAGADGGIFSFGDTPFFGSLPGASPPVRVGAPITALASSPDGRGYWLAGADGGVFAFGDASYLGSLPALGLSLPAAGAITALAARP